MNFAFTPEQEELRAIVRQFFATTAPEQAIRAQMDTDRGWDLAVWKQAAQQLELQGMTIPERHGGSGYTFVELAVVLEEMGRALFCAPFFSTVVLAANALLLSEDEDTCAAYLPEITSGELTATLAFAERGRAWDDPSAETTAKQGAGGDWLITGTKSYVLDGCSAGLILVTAMTDEGLALFRVDSDASGLSRKPLATLDQTRKQATLGFEQVRGDVVGHVGDAARVLTTVLQLAYVGLALEQIGGAQRVLELAVDYAKVREQFGRPIGSFQAIKHKCADMLLQVESAKSAAYYGAWCAAEMNDELPAIAHMAQSYCSEAYLLAASENVQIHGGIGFTWEHPAHLYFKRAKSSELLFAGPSQHRERLVRHLGLAS